MLVKELLNQVKRLFSSKNNGGKLVSSLTDRLHFYKLVLFALSLAIVVGYGQFREHFACPAIGNIDKKQVTNFCWTNGTSTVVAKLAPSSEDNQARQVNASELNNKVPHVGIRFNLDDDNYLQLEHNYMKHIWALLIVMSLCSYLSRLSWSSIFNNDTLRAILKLPGFETLTQTLRVQQLQPCETLKRQRRQLVQNGDNNHRQQQQQQQFVVDNLQLARSGASDKMTPTSPDLGQLDMVQQIELFIGEENLYNHTLDHHADHLVYFLLPLKSSAYKLAQLDLRWKLLNHACLSFAMSCLQHLFPLLMFGGEYKLFGWRYLHNLTSYTISQLTQPTMDVASVDYDISARLFPTQTQCEYKQFGQVGLEQHVVICQAPINEISAKAFALIWWMIILSILIESVQLVWLLTCAISFEMAATTLGRVCWPRTRLEADMVAVFRFSRCVLLDSIARAKINRLEFSNNISAPPMRSTDLTGNVRLTASVSELGALDRKRLEAETSSLAPETRNEMKLWIPRHSELSTFQQLGMSMEKSSRDAEGFREKRDDHNIYFLLYLLYLRLDKSSRKLEQVIKSVHQALESHLHSLQVDDELSGCKLSRSIHYRS